MFRFIRNSILFGVAVLIALQLIEYSAPYYWANKGLAVKMKYWKKSKTDFNAVFIGSSRTQMHIMPSVFDSLTNHKTRSFNLGYGSTYAEEAMHFTEQLLEDKLSNDLSYIFLEVRPIWFNPDNLFTSRGKYILSYSEYQFLRSYYSKTDKEFAPSDYRLAYMEKLLKIGMIRDLIVYDCYSRFTRKNNFLLGSKKDGFLNRNEAIDLDAQNALLQEAGSDLVEVERKLGERTLFARASYQNLHAVSEADQMYVNRLKDIQQRAAAKGIELYFYPTIRFENTNVAAIVQSTGGSPPFLYASSPDAYPKLYDLDWSGDVSHLNQPGAHYYSQLLAELFRDAVLNQPAK